MPRTSSPPGTTGRASTGAGPAERRGTALVLSSYVLWGLFPLYFRLLDAAGAVEILSHRIVLTALTCLLLVTATRGWERVRAAVGQRRQLLALAAAGVLVTLNWLVYVYGVITGRTADAALGYFINPLVTVALAALVLGERLRRAQGVAIVLAVIAVAVASQGRLPWISLALAASFGLYGLVKHQVRVDALTGLTLESCLVLPLGLGYLTYLAATGSLALQGPQGSVTLGALFLLSGPVTAVPLLLFAAGARRVPLSTVGIVQFLGPVLQFLLAWLVLGEAISPTRWAAMAVIAVASVVFCADLVAQMRSLPRTRRS